MGYGRENEHVVIRTDLPEIASQLASKANQKELAYRPEQYGAIGDGVADDTTAINNFVSDCLSKGKSMELNGNYKVTSLITIDGNSKPINFIVNGSIIASGSGFLFKNITGGKQRIVLKGGGSGSAVSIGVQTSNCVGLTLEVYGDAYGGIVLKSGGNKQDNTGTLISNIRLICRNGCYQALEHGDNISGKYQDAFGTYEYIYDLDSLNGIVFQNSNDITIKHLENHFYDTSNIKDGLTFNKCGAVHCDNIAIGGRAKNQINIISSTMDFNKLYTVNEDPSTLISNGLTIDNLSTVMIHYHKDSRSNIAINYPTVGGTFKVSNIFCGGSGTVVNAGGTNQGLPTGQLTSYASSPYLYATIVKPIRSGANQFFVWQSDDGTKNHYFLGKNVTDGSFRIESYDQSTGAWLGDPVFVDSAGNIRVGMNATSKVGFFGNTGAVKQTVSGAKGGNAALTSLITALVNMGLITDTTT